MVLLLGICWVPGAASAQTSIYTCTDADGGIEYSQLPCTEPKSEEPVVAESAPESSQDDQEPDANEAACKKRYRDAIDEIDAEIRSESSRDKDDEFKQRLLVLTRKLRECGS